MDNHLGSSSTADHGSSGADSGDGGTFSGVGAGFGAVSNSGEVGGLGKKHNHMIHLHLIPHIYVPVVHSAGYSEAKNYHTSVEGGSSTAPVHNSNDLSSEFHASAGDTGSAHGPTGSAENPSSAVIEDHNHGNFNGIHDQGSFNGIPDHGNFNGIHDHGHFNGIHDHGNFNGHSGESPFFALSGDNVHQHHQNMHENTDNTIGSVHHNYDMPSNSGSGEPHQYQVRNGVIDVVLSDLRLEHFILISRSCDGFDVSSVGVYRFCHYV